MSTYSVETATPLKKLSIGPDAIYRVLFGRPMTEILMSAYDLRVFDLLAKAPQDLDEVCEALALPRHTADMLLHTCVAMGLLQKTEGQFSNSIVTQEYLVSSGPCFLGGLLEH